MNVGKEAKMLEEKCLAERMRLSKGALGKVLASLGYYFAVMIIMNTFA